MAHVLHAMWKCHTVKERCQAYRDYGVRVGEKCFIDYGVWIDPATPSNIIIEDYVTISYGCTILSHDSSLSVMTNFPAKIYKTTLKKNCYIGAGSIILGGVTIGENSIVGAGSVVVSNVEDNMVVVGNPARIIKSTKKHLEDERKNFANNPESYFFNKPLSRPPLDDLPDYLK